MADADPFAKYATPAPADPFAKYAARPDSGSFLDKAGHVIEAVSSYMADNPVTNYVGQEIQSGVVDPAKRLFADTQRAPVAPQLNPLPKLQQDAQTATDAFNAVMALPNTLAHATLMRPYGALMSALTGGGYKASDAEGAMGLALFGLGPEAARGNLPLRPPAPHMVDAFTVPKAPKPVEAPGSAKPAEAATVAPAAEPAPAARSEDAPALPDTRGQGVQYHGARGPIEKLDPEGYYSPDNIYGGTDTFYTTDAADIAKGYGRKNPNALIYEAHERQPVKMFDMEHPLDEAELHRIFAINSDDFGLVPMSIDEALQNGKASLRDVMDEIRGQSRGEGYSKDDVQEEFNVAIERLKADGFGGMQHVGGLKTGKAPHSVKIYFNAANQLDLRSAAFAQKTAAEPRPAAMAAAVDEPPEAVLVKPETEPPPPTGGPLSFVRPVEPKSFWADRKAEIDGKGWAGAIADWAEHGYTSLVAEQHPLVRATEQLRSGIEGATGKPLDLLPSEDPTKLARAGHDVFNIGHMDVMHGVHDYRGVEPTSPALADVVASVTAKEARGDLDPPGALKQFNDYLTARRGVEEWDRYDRGELENEPLPVAAGGDRANLEMHIAQAEAANPRYVEMADAVNQYGRALWKKQLDAGLIDRATYDGANAAREFYVPFKRAMDEGATIKGAGSSGEGSIAKGFKGSNRDVMGPMEALVNQTYEVARRIRQNDINLSLVKLARQFEEAMAAKGVEAPNGLLERVKEPNRPMGLAPDELKAMTNRNAPDDLIDTMFDEDAMHVWRPGEINAKGRPIVYAWENGKRTAWEIKDKEWGADIFNAMTGVSKPVDDLIIRAGAAASATLRAGVTTNPEFMFTNFLRDQMSAWILTGDGFIPGEGALGVADEIGGSDVTRKYNLAGGIAGGQAVEASRSAAIQADIMSLRHQGFAAKYVPTMDDVVHDQMNLVRKLASVAEITETGTRLQLFKRAYARAIGEGMSEHDAILEAGFTARDYIDFGRNGSRMAATRKVITFLNASIQGLDKTLRTATADFGLGGRVALKDILRPLFEDTPEGMRASDAKKLRLAYSAWTKMSAVGGLGLALTALYHDDPQYQNISEYGRASAWFFKLGDHWIAVPKPFVEGLPSNIAERAFEATYGQDDQAWSRLARGAMQNLALPADNPFLKTNLELATNKNLMTGGSIVPDQKLGMLPADQYAYYNSAMSKHLGEAINVSPAKIDHMLTGYFGSWGRWAQATSNLTDPDRPAMGLSDMVLSRRFFPSWQRGAQDSTDFFQRVGSRTSEFQQLFNSVKERQDAGHPDQAAHLLDHADDTARIYVASRLANDGKARNLNPLSRAQTVGTEIGRVISELYGEPERGVAKTLGQPDAESQLPKMNAQQKGVVQNVLEQLAVVEMRNAMIATHQPGFENKKPMDRAAYVAQLQAASPGVAAALQRRLDSGREKAFDYDATMKAWPAVESRLRRDGEKADLTDILMDVRSASRR